MRNVAKVLAVLFATLITWAGPAHGITFGQPDGGRHPNVGALVAKFDGEPSKFCSGTLISRTVFLTAAHCLVFLPSVGVERDEIFVSFDPTFDESSPLIGGTYYANPAYGEGGFARIGDVGVVVLDRAVNRTPARLPTAGLLDRLKSQRQLRDQVFTAVGYGTIRTSKRRGPLAILPNSKRRFALQSFNALNKNWLRLSMQPATGDGGTCYGDSGGPHFLGGVRSNLIVSITVTGDVPCRATDVTYRLDAPSARSFLKNFVRLP